MKIKWISFCLVVLLLVCLPLTAAAQEWDPGQHGSLSVSLVSKSTGTPMAGAELSVFQVATVGYDAGGSLFYSYTTPFAGCGISLTDPELTGKLDTFVETHNITCHKIVTDSQGTAACLDLPLGLYFVKQTNQVEGFAPCTPFLVSIPGQTEDGLQYDVDASPKTEAARLINITVQKVWNADKSTEVPDSVTVQLLRGEKILCTDVLSAQNNWQVVYTNMPESDAYYIREVDVPKGFTATYSQAGYTFTVTNTSSLVQTGQLVWPIPLLAAAGLFLLLVGFALLRKTGKRHA